MFAKGSLSSQLGGPCTATWSTGWNTQLLTIANSSSDLAHTPSASAAVHNTEVATAPPGSRPPEAVSPGHARPEVDEDEVQSSLFRTNPLANQETTERRVSAKERSKQMSKAKARKEGRKDKNQPAVQQHDPAQ